MTNAKVVIEKDWLLEQFSGGVTQKQVSEILHCSCVTVRARMKELGITCLNVKAKRTGIWQDRDWLYQRRVVDGIDMHTMAKEAGCCYATIQHELSKRGFVPNRVREQVQATEPVMVDAWLEPDIDCLTCRRHKCGGCPLENASR